MNDTQKSKRGGKREGAGRKSNKEKLGLPALLSDAISDNEWIEIFIALKNKAKRGDSVSAKLLLAYAFGEPDKRIEINGSKENPLIVKGYFTISPDEWDKADSDVQPADVADSAVA